MVRELEGPQRPRLLVVVDLRGEPRKRRRDRGVARRRSRHRRTRRRIARRPRHRGGRRPRHGPVRSPLEVGRRLARAVPGRAAHRRRPARRRGPPRARRGLVVTPTPRAGRRLGAVPHRGARRPMFAACAVAPAGRRRSAALGRRAHRLPRRLRRRPRRPATTGRRCCASSSPRVAPWCCMMFLASLAGRPNSGFASLQVPLAEVFIWLMLLHAIDSPGRRGLFIALLSSVVLIAVAGVLSISMGIAPYIVVWAICGHHRARARAAGRARAAPRPRPDPRAPRPLAAARRGRPSVAVPRSRCVVLGAGYLHGRPRRGHRPGAHVPRRAPARRVGPGARRAVQPVARLRPTPRSRPNRASQTARAGLVRVLRLLEPARHRDPGPARQHARHAGARVGARLLAGASPSTRGTAASGPRRAPGRSSIRGGQPIEIPPAPDDGPGSALVGTDKLVQTYYIEQPGPNAIFAAATPTQLLLHRPDRVPAPRRLAACRRAARQGQRVHGRQQPARSRPPTLLRAVRSAPPAPRASSCTTRHRR